MRKIVFNHPKFPQFANLYIVSDKGNVYKNSIKAPELTYHSYSSGGKFVRLSCGKDKQDISFSVGKLVLLAFNIPGYGKDKIALHLSENKADDSLENLKWGERADQTEISMRDPEYAKRIGAMSKTYHNNLENKKNR